MASRRSVMTLFSAPDEPQSHRVRIVLAEKASECDVISVVPGRYPEDLLDLNPYRSLPTLVDRDLVLYDARVIIDYLDERFPHPPLMPVDPVLRAQFRLAISGAPAAGAVHARAAPGQCTSFQYSFLSSHAIQVNVSRKSTTHTPMLRRSTCAGSPA